MEAPNGNKPEWLLNLEKESWQAELIISGLAIFGSLQLPNLIDRFGQWAFTYFSPEVSLFLLLFLIFLHFTSGILIFAFISHFILRAIWIGLIGLNSVFPEGIKTEGGMYSRIFMEKFKANYAHKNYGITALDNFCSGIFAICTVVVLFSIAFCTLILVLYGLNVLLSSFLPNYIIDILTGLLLIFSIIPSIAMAILKRDKYAENEKLQTRFYKFFNFFSIIFFHIVRKPALYISFVLSTNLKVKQYLFSMLGIFILLYGFSFYRIFDSGNFLFINQDLFFSSYTRVDRTSQENYEEYLTEESTPIYSAIIESKLIKGEMMSIFIPIFSNEESIYTAVCGAFVEDESLSRDQNIAATQQYYTQCYQKYHKIYVNDIPYEFELVKFTHPHRSSEGVITYIPTEKFNKGKNILRVDKIRDKEETVYRAMMIPFWFEGKRE